MAKYQRTTIGTVLKSKEEGKGDYIKISQDVVLKKGDFLELESKKSALKNLEYVVETGKLDKEYAEKVRERLNKWPEWARFNIVKVSKQA